MKTIQPACTAQANAPAFGCLNNTIRLRSGRYFDLANPKPDQFTLGDVAGALSKICRFGGQIERFYSVAEHLIHCCGVAVGDGLPVEAQRAVFLHDAAEAFCGDMVKPLKVMMPEYSRVERAAEAAVAEMFDVDFEQWKAEIRQIDHGMLIAERNYFFSRDDVEWTGEREARKLVDVYFEGWLPPQAEAQFLIAARQLGLRTSL